jgi:hypothetical protein
MILSLACMKVSLLRLFFRLGASEGAASNPIQMRDCLWGAVRFGDNIEDEWFVVALLVRISEQYPALSIQVRDGGVVCSTSSR